MELTVIFLLLPFALQTTLANLKEFSFHTIDRNALHWIRIQHMPCTHRLLQDGFQGIWRCIFECAHDTESFMVGTNASHCILCYYQVNNATLKAAEFQGTLLFKRGKLQSVMNLFKPAFRIPYKT